LIAMVCLIGATVLWGTSFLVTKVAVDEVSPMVVTFVRCVIAAVLLGAYAIVGSTRSPSARARPGGGGRTWMVWAAACGVATGVAFQSTAMGMQHAGSSVAGVTVATIPAWTMLVAGLMGLEQIGRRQLVSVAIGSAALVLLAVPGEGGWAIRGVLALSVAALAHACANLASHCSLRGSGPVPIAAFSLVVAAVITAPGALLAWPSTMPGMSSLVAILALGALPSAAAYVMYFHAIDVLGATRASLSMYVIPPLAILVGVLLLGERPGWSTAIAFVLAICALAIGVGEHPADRPLLTMHAMRGWDRQRTRAR
jgi:drug/metabolite transporter (DMT)-like permease